MKKILIHAWAVQKKENRYYLPYTHWIYLNEIRKYYDEVVLLSSCKCLEKEEITDYIDITFQNTTVYELPYSTGYVDAVKYFFAYKEAYQKIKDVTTYYSRYPAPFGWLQKVYGKKEKRIIHYVGDPIDAAKNNPNFTKLRKMVLINAFKPENYFYNWACRGAKVFTNGHHIAEKLAKRKIGATPLISSTLTENDFFFKNKIINPENSNFIYLGYLRKAKGVETIIKAFGILQKKRPNIKLTIIGSGEFEQVLKSVCENQHINNVSFLGHIDDRTKINNLLRSHDVFLFGSLSEGSPRVILEAMANGLSVISTPVGSLPKTFEDKKEILFAEFNNEIDFSNKMLSVLEDNTRYNLIRTNAFEKVKSYTIENFIKKIFYED